ncbi:MAG: nucleotidyltransferase domain-containing protein [Acidobacteriota bacterium]
MNRRMAKLRKIFKKRGVLLAYLFGSQQDAGKRFLEGASYEIQEPSDLDVGLLVAPSSETLYESYGNLYLELSRVFAPFNIDIVLLEEVHSLLKFEIISGYRLYAQDEQFADDFEDIVIKFASDLAIKRRMFEPDFIKAIEDGHFEIEYP